MDSLHFTSLHSLHFTSLNNQKVRSRHKLKGGSTEGLGAHGLNVHGFRICGFAAHGALRALFGLEILFKIKPNEKYENLKFFAPKCLKSDTFGKFFEKTISPSKF